MIANHKILHILFLVMLFLPSQHLSGQNADQDLGIRTVVIDPGHGGKDSGALGKTRKTDEKHLVLSNSKLLGNKIKTAYPNVKVVYTRSTDVFVELKERANIAKRNNADLFISIHCNSNNSSRPYGASAHILGPKSKTKSNQKDYFAASMSVAQRENSVMLLEDDYKTSYQDFNPESAESVISSSLLWSANYNSSLMLAAELDGVFRKSPFRESNYTGIHQDVFYLLWATNMPAVLLELGFISNTEDYQYMSSSAGQEQIAQRLFEAFKVYKTNIDASVDLTTAIPEPEPVQTQSPVVSEPVAAIAVPEVYYGVQIMGLGRKLASDDPALKGLSVEIVPPAEGGKIYKYVAGASDTLEKAKSKLASVRKKFPDAFLVKVEGSEVTRIR